MARLSRVTQQIFGSNAGFDQIAQFGSLKAGTPTFTTNIATIQALSNYLVGWFNAVIGGNSPAIEDMNALFYLITTQLAYVLDSGISEYDAGTTYYTGNIVNQPVVVFLVTSANATVGATYTNNTQTFTVQSTITTDNRLVCTYTGKPTTSGTLTKASGTGDATITFSSASVSQAQWCSIADTNLGNALTNTSFWMPSLPALGKPFQRLSANSTSSAYEFTYHTINDQVPLNSYTVPVGYNLCSGFVTIQSGVTYTIQGSAVIGGRLIIQTGGQVIVSGSTAMLKIN